MKDKELSQSNNMSNNRVVVSPVSSFSDNNGAGDVSINLSSIPSDKLLAVLQNVDDNCKFCAKKNSDHVHFIVSSQLIIDPSIELPKLVDVEPRKCYACGDNSGNLKQCSQCKTATYCDVRCQLNDWAKHCLVCSAGCNGYAERMDVTDASISRIIDSHSKPKNNVSVLSPKSVAKDAPKESTPIITVTNSLAKVSLNSASNLVRSVPNETAAKVVNAKDDQPIDYIASLNTCVIDLNKKIEVLVLYQDTSDNSIFHITSDAEMLSELMGKCALFGEKFKSSVKPKDGVIYLVKHSDNDWYRALILDSKPNTPDSALAFFIDFGNADEISTEFIMPLCDELSVSTIPALAIKCVVTPSQKNLKDIQKKIGKAVDGTYLLKIEAISKDGNDFVVNVY